MKVPYWINKRFHNIEKLKDYKIPEVYKKLNLHTVCEEAHCPNIKDCFTQGTATFLILGKTCTRNCSFCAVEKGIPQKIDSDEPKRVAYAVKEFGLSYSVITSVTRDDLFDGGGEQFALTIKEIKKLGVKCEVLVPLLPDDGIKKVIEAGPVVINHNIETVPSLYPTVRPKFNYYESINFLFKIKKMEPQIITKSGIILGLGEKADEVINVMKDLVGVGVDIFTIGQYLRPSGFHIPVVKYIQPEKFEEYKEIGYRLGFKYVISSPYTRSSYKAEEAYNYVIQQLK